jgi:hypothetical protein
VNEGISIKTIEIIRPIDRPAFEQKTVEHQGNKRKHSNRLKKSINELEATTGSRVLEGDHRRVYAD